MAQGSPAPVYLTVKEFEEYDVPDDMRAELVRGELLLISPPGFRHGAVVARLIEVLSAFVRTRGLGYVTTDSGYELVGLYRTVRAPDIAFVSASRLPADDLPVGLAHLRPDLAVEVLSPGETRARLNEKLDDFQAVDVPLVWIIDPERRTIVVIENGKRRGVLNIDDTLDGGSVLPDFWMRVSDMF